MKWRGSDGVSNEDTRKSSPKQWQEPAQSPKTSYIRTWKDASCHLLLAKCKLLKVWYWSVWHYCVSISSFSSVRFYFMYFGTLLLGTYMFIIIVSCIFLIHWPFIIKYPSLSLHATLWTGVCQAPLTMEFSRQEYWSGLLFPPPWDLPDPGIFVSTNSFFLKSIFLSC